MEKKKNGEIELLRFIFAMIIVIFHFNIKFSLNMFYWGRLGVEFFFIVTGVLFAMSIKRIDIDRKNIHIYTWSIIKRKILSFLPYYIMALLFNEICLNILIHHNTFNGIIKNFIKAIPRLLFFDCFGFRTSSNFQLGVDWYFSAMISAFFILLPILLYNYEFVSKLICPLLSIIGLGFCFLKYDTACATTDLKNTFIDPLLIRGISNISLGVCGYEFALYIKESKLTNLSKTLLTLLKWICLILTIIFAYRDIYKIYSLAPIILIFVAVILSFSNITYNIPYNAITKFFGKLSLPIFLTHYTIRNILANTIGNNMEKWGIWTVIILCPVFAYVFMVFTDLIFAQLKKIKTLFIKE